MSFLKRIRDRFKREGGSKVARDSGNWFADKIKNMKNPRSEKSKGASAKNFRELNSRLRSSAANSIKPGSIVTYNYQAKLDGILPYWDRFPLVIVIDVNKDGWFGMNLHYLPPETRALLLDKLSKFWTDTRMDDKTRLRVTYRTLKASTKYREVQPCLKRYLTTQVRSKVFFIPAEEMEQIIFLPYESFKGASSNRVWEDSLQAIKKAVQRDND